MGLTHSDISDKPNCTIMVLGQNNSGRSHLIRHFIENPSVWGEKDHKVKKVENGEKVSKTLGINLTPINVDVYNGMGGKRGEMSYYEGLMEDKERIEDLRNKEVDIDCFIVTADMTNPDCKSIVEDYLEMISKFAAPNAQVIVVGTKSENRERRVEEEFLESVKSNPVHPRLVITDVKVTGTRNSGPLALAVTLKLDNDRKNDDNLVKVIDECLSGDRIEKTKEIVAIQNIIDSRQSSDSKLSRIRAISENKYNGLPAANKQNVSTFFKNPENKSDDNVNTFYGILKNNNSVDCVTELQKFIQKADKKAKVAPKPKT